MIVSVLQMSSLCVFDVLYIAGNHRTSPDDMKKSRLIFAGFSYNKYFCSDILFLCCSYCTEVADVNPLIIFLFARLTVLPSSSLIYVIVTLGDE